MHTLSSSSWSSIIYTSSVNSYRPPRLEEKGILDVAICRVPSHFLDFNISPLNIVLKAESLKFNFPMVKHFVVLTPNPSKTQGVIQDSRPKILMLSPFDTRAVCKVKTEGQVSQCLANKNMLQKPRPQ